jgi:hypothetical protein
VKGKGLFDVNSAVLLFAIILLSVGLLSFGCSKAAPGAASASASQQASPQAVAQASSQAENAWDDYQKAIGAVNSPTMPEWLMETFKNDKFTAEQNKFLDDRQEVVNAILAGSGKTRSELFKSTPDFNTKLPHLMNLRTAANIALADAHRLELQGKYKECVERELAVYKMGTRLAGPNSTVLCSLVGVAIRTLAIDYMFSTMSQGRCSEDLLKKMAHEVSVIDASMATALSAYKGEFGMLNLSAVTCPPPYKEKERQEDYTARLTAENKKLFAALTPHFEKYDGEGAEKVIIAFRAPLEKKYKTSLADDQSVKTLMSKCADSKDVADLVILSVYVSLRKTTCHFYISRMNGLALQVLTAAEAFKKRTGKYPATLREACEEAAIEPPPVDPITGKPLGYKVAGGVVTVWGAGLDGVDNGGVEPKTLVNPPAGSDLVYRSGALRPRYGLR